MSAEEARQLRDRLEDIRYTPEPSLTLTLTLTLTRTLTRTLTLTLTLT